MTMPRFAALAKEVPVAGKVKIPPQFAQYASKKGGFGPLARAARHRRASGLDALTGMRSAGTGNILGKAGKTAKTKAVETNDNQAGQGQDYPTRKSSMAKGR